MIWRLVYSQAMRYYSSMNRLPFRLITGVLILLFVSLPLSAAGPNVDYLDGHLEYRQGRDTWIEAKTGHEIPEGSTVRLSNNGYAELAMGNRIVTLNGDGVYDLVELFDDESEKQNIWQVLGSKVSALGGRGRVSDTSSQAALRHSEAEVEETLYDGDYLYNGKYYFDKGVKAYGEGNMKEARTRFESALWEFDQGIYDALDEAEERVFIFNKGLCLARLERYRESRDILTVLQPELDDPFIADYTIVVGTLYLESREYDEMDRVLGTYLDAEPRGEAAQLAWLLSAYGLQEQDRISEANTAARNAVNLGPNTEIGMAAAELIQ